MNDDLFVCEAVQTLPSDQLALNLAAVIGQGKITAKAMRIAGKLSRTIRGATCTTELEASGLSERQAAAVLASINLGREICSMPLRKGERFANSRDIFQRYRARFYSAHKEYFVTLSLNSKNQLIREILVSVGSLSSSVVHPREAFAPLVRDSAAAAIFLHNHPSGDPSPSRDDRECTQRLFQAGKILGIRVLDHIVLGYEDYFSFADASLLTPE
jgi:DNA repair protein RadC